MSGYSQKSSQSWLCWANPTLRSFLNLTRVYKPNWSVSPPLPKGNLPSQVPHEDGSVATRPLLSSKSVVRSVTPDMKSPRIQQASPPCEDVNSCCYRCTLTAKLRLFLGSSGWLPSAIPPLPAELKKPAPHVPVSYPNYTVRKTLLAGPDILHQPNLHLFSPLHTPRQVLPGAI